MFFSFLFFFQSLSWGYEKQNLRPTVFFFSGTILKVSSVTFPFFLRVCLVQYYQCFLAFHPTVDMYMVNTKKINILWYCFLFLSFLLFTYTISQINRKVRSLLVRHSCNEVYSAAKAGGTGSFSACRWLSVLPGKQKNNKKARPWNTSTRHVDTQAFSQEISAETTTASGKSAGYAIWGRLLMLNSMD